MVRLNPIPTLMQKFEDQVVSTINKYGYPPFGRSTRTRIHETRPPYERRVSPFWLKSVSEANSLVNNAIEEKVKQSFRRGFTAWEKEYEAKCPDCDKEYETLEPFVDQLGEEADEVIDEDDIDLDVERPCPECGTVDVMETPDPEDREFAEEFCARVNMRDETAEVLQPDEQNSIEQTFLELCEEVGRDIQTFDDGWMIFERSYTLDEDGCVVDWTLQEVFRAPPYLMRYSVDQQGKIGGEKWVCIECRAKNPDDYKPDGKPGPCEECGNRTYEAMAYAVSEATGDQDDAERYYIRGEFVHGSEYAPSFLYGLSPIFSVWEEARTLEQMDSWYQSAYEQRRAPRGAIVVKSSNAESVRAWNTEQMEKLNADDQHIPTFINDTEDGGKPIEWVPLLEDPAAMQHMEMREWFLDRISAKYGVTAVFQTGGAESSGMSQSLEIVVANRSSERLQQVFRDVFLPAFIGQLQVEGWTMDLKPPEEEDEEAEAQRVGRELQNAQIAAGLGADVEWTRDDSADIKPGKLQSQEQEEGMMGALGGGEGPGDPTPAEGEPGGTTTPEGGRPDEPEAMGGAPDEPADPTTDDPFALSAKEGGNNSVTSGDAGGPGAGYRNPTYGDPDRAEVIDYLEQVREQIEGSKSEMTVETLVESATSKIEESDIDVDVRSVQRFAEQPAKSFQDLRRADGGEWRSDYEANHAVRLLYEVFEHG